MSSVLPFPDAKYRCILADPPWHYQTGVHQDIIAPVREHSRKPDEQYDRIERLLGLTEPGDKIELFARQSWPGWDSWGLETGRFDADVTESDLQVAMEL